VASMQRISFYSIATALNFWLPVKNPFFTGSQNLSAFLTMLRSIYCKNKFWVRAQSLLETFSESRAWWDIVSSGWLSQSHLSWDLAKNSLLQILTSIYCYCTIKLSIYETSYKQCSGRRIDWDIQYWNFELENNLNFVKSLARIQAYWVSVLSGHDYVARKGILFFILRIEI